MKKTLWGLIVIALSCGTAFAGGYDYLAPTNETNRNFTTLRQHQFEKEETLDFINNSEEYKANRAKKEKFLDYREGKVDIPQEARTQFNLQSSRPGSSNLRFVKDENGKIRIIGD